MKNIRKVIFERDLKDKLQQISLKNNINTKQIFNESMGKFNKIKIGNQFSHTRSKTLTKELNRIH